MATSGIGSDFGPKASGRSLPKTPCRRSTRIQKATEAPVSDVDTEPLSKSQTSGKMVPARVRKTPRSKVRTIAMESPSVGSPVVADGTHSIGRQEILTNSSLPFPQYRDNSEESSKIPSALNHDTGPAEAARPCPAEPCTSDTSIEKGLEDSHTEDDSPLAHPRPPNLESNPHAYVFAQVRVPISNKYKSSISKASKKVIDSPDKISRTPPGRVSKSNAKRNRIRFDVAKGTVLPSQGFEYSTMMGSAYYREDEAIASVAVRPLPKHRADHSPLQFVDPHGLNLSTLPSGLREAATPAIELTPTKRRCKNATNTAAQTKQISGQSITPLASDRAPIQDFDSMVGKTT